MTEDVERVAKALAYDCRAPEFDELTPPDPERKKGPPRPKPRAGAEEK